MVRDGIEVLAAPFYDIYPEIITPWQKIYGAKTMTLSEWMEQSEDNRLMMYFSDHTAHTLRELIDAIIELQFRAGAFLTLALWYMYWVGEWMILLDPFDPLVEGIRIFFRAF